MKKTLPLLLSSVIALGLVAGCSSDTDDNTIEGTSSTSQSSTQTPTTPAPVETSDGTAQNLEAIKPAALETVTGYMESIMNYTTADLEAATTPEDTKTLLEPSLKYFYTGDLAEEDAQKVESIVKMSVQLWTSSVESSDQSEEIKAQHQSQIDALRADPSTLDLIMSEDNKTLVAVAPSVGGIPLVEVDGAWLIDGKGTLVQMNGS